MGKKKITSENSKLVIAISSRALFNLDHSHKIFKEEGIEAYARHQQENEHVVLEPGVGFTLVKKLLKLKGSNFFNIRYQYNQKLVLGSFIDFGMGYNWDGFNLQKDTLTLLFAIFDSS